MTEMMEFNDACNELEKEKDSKKIRIKNDKSNLSMEIKKIKNLIGIEQPRFSNLSDGSIVTLFDNTPYPEKDNDVVCPHFVELKWANGCNFDCAWCYLNGTLRFRPDGKKPYLKDAQKIINHIRAYFALNPNPSLVNSGELSDSLTFEGTNNSLTNLIIPLFQEQDTHKLLILTKSTNIKGILKSNAMDSVIISFSVNSRNVAKRWESKAPTPLRRLNAAKKLFDAGYEVRLRIDPIVPIDNWKEDYLKLVDLIFAKFIPGRITLGSLRGLQSTINFCKDKSWVDYLDAKSNWGKKIGDEKRLEIYSTIIEYMNNSYNFQNIGLCKETVQMWNKLRGDYQKIKCNCIL